MSIETSVTIKRGKAQPSTATTYVPRAFGGTLVIPGKAQGPIATGVEVQLDNISEFVVASSGGAIPNNSYTLISLGGGIPDIQNGDLLIDEGTEPWNIDTHTSSGKAEYRASGTPDIYPYDHMEIRVTRFVEKTP